MKSQDTNPEYADLISRYLSGEATDAEVQTLEAWVLASPENKKQFISFKKAWFLSRLDQKSTAIDVQDQWEKVSKGLFGPKKQPRTLSVYSKRRTWLSIAASLALLLAAVVWLWPTQAAAPLVFTTTNEPLQIDLPDGSQVQLNRASTLRFTLRGEQQERKVELRGDAFFVVERDAVHPFVIETDDQVEVEVLGTAFYVDARTSQSATQVTVRSGSVAVRTNQSSVTLVANEKAVVQKTSGTIQKMINQDPNYSSLVSDTLTFEQTPLREVAVVLNRHFNVNIEVVPEINECIWTAMFIDKSLETILAILEATFDEIVVERKGGQLLIKGQRCG